MNEAELRKEIVDVCYKMWQQGWVAANDGNVSVRLEPDVFLITPSGVSKSRITQDMLLKVDGSMNVIEGPKGLKPSSEIRMHMRCYRDRADVGAVVHAHPPTATGYAVAGIPLDQYSMIETVIAIGSVPVTPYGTPSTDEVPENIAPYLPEHDVLLNAENILKEGKPVPRVWHAVGQDDYAYPVGLGLKEFFEKFPGNPFRYSFLTAPGGHNDTFKEFALKSFLDDVMKERA